MIQYVAALVFFLAVMGVLFASHFFLYVSFLSFFPFSTQHSRYVLVGALIVLSLSFAFTSVLAHWRDDAFTRGLYLAAASWLGFLTYFVLFFIVAWTVSWAASRLGMPVSNMLLWWWAVSLAVLTGAYGLWNAANPRIVERTVSIKWLDERWDGKKIIQISDVHLGHILRQDFLWNIVDKINYVRGDLVVITGDFFDGMDGNLEHLSEPLNDIDSKHGTYYVDGNHETYLGRARSIAAITESRINLLDDRVEWIDGLQLVGISFPERGEKKDVLATMRSLPGFDPGKPYVLLYHKPFDIPRDENVGSGLFLAGHTHLGQIFPFRYIVRMVFGDFSYGLSRRGDLNVYVSSGVGTWWPPMRVGTVPEIVVLTLRRSR